MLVKAGILQVLQLILPSSIKMWVLRDKRKRGRTRIAL